MKQESYNGYTNYATWLVALHINNDQSMQNHVFHIWEMGSQDDCDWGLYDYGQALKEWMDELTDAVDEAIPNSYLVVDLISATLVEVNWRELAEFFANDYKEITESEIA
jgi:hypothetical protein